MAKMKSIQEEMSKRGFSKSETGGGCTGYEMPTSIDTSILITNEGAECPQSYEESIIIGIYFNEGSSWIQLQFPTLNAFFTWYDETTNHIIFRNVISE